MKINKLTSRADGIRLATLAALAGDRAGDLGSSGRSLLQDRALPFGPVLVLARTDAEKTRDRSDEAVFLYVSAVPDTENHKWDSLGWSRPVGSLAASCSAGGFSRASRLRRRNAPARALPDCLKEGILLRRRGFYTGAGGGRQAWG